MLLKRFKRSTALAALTAVVFPLAAQAQFKDADGAIHIQNLSAGQKISISSGELTKKITANFCGLVTVGIPTGQSMPASVMVGTDTITVASLPVQTVPRCVNNVLAETRSANFKDSNGRVIVVNKTPGTQYTVIYTGTPALKSYTANTCGLVKVSNTTNSPAPASFTYNGTAFTTSSLPTQTPAKCISGVKYVPQ
jgi:hypothetical protein